NGLPPALPFVRAASLDEVVDLGVRQAEALGGAEIDVRPVTEAWDIGLGVRPAHMPPSRYMALLKAGAASEADTEPSAPRRAALPLLTDEARRQGRLVAAE